MSDKLKLYKPAQLSEEARNKAYNQWYAQNKDNRDGNNTELVKTVELFKRLTGVDIDWSTTQDGYKFRLSNIESIFKNPDKVDVAQIRGVRAFKVIASLIEKLTKTKMAYVAFKDNSYHGRKPMLVRLDSASKHVDILKTNNLLNNDKGFSSLNKSQDLVLYLKCALIKLKYEPYLSLNQVLSLAFHDFFAQAQSEAEWRLTMAYFLTFADDNEYLEDGSIYSTYYSRNFGLEIDLSEAASREDYTNWCKAQQRRKNVKSDNHTPAAT